MNESRCWTEGLGGKSGVWNIASRSNGDTKIKRDVASSKPHPVCLSRQIKVLHVPCYFSGQKAI